MKTNQIGFAVCCSRRHSEAFNSLGSGGNFLAERLAGMALLRLRWSVVVLVPAGHLYYYTYIMLENISLIARKIA